MGHEDRVVGHVGAAQVEQPGHIVNGGDEVVAGASCGRSGAHMGELVLAADAGLRRQVLEDRGCGQAGAVFPGAGDHIHMSVQVQVGGLQRAPDLLGQGQAQHLTVHRQRLAGLQVLDDPVDVVGGRGRHDLDQGDAGAGQFGLGLRPVAAVGKQGGAVQRHHQGGHRARETRCPLAALPAVGQVFGEMRIGRRDQRGVAAAGAQGIADSLQAQRDRVGAGVHVGALSRACGFGAKNAILAKSVILAKSSLLLKATIFL